ncbi:hypothetical protein VTO73DRAFT_9956 [Trametes versicolor]
MSPQYTTKTSSHSKSHSSFAKTQKMLEEEDPRFRGLDRMLARAYIELQRKRAQQQRAGLFMPRMDVCDDPEDVVITAMLELPGMKADQLSVRIENGQLIIEGERTGPHLHLHTGSRHAASSEPTRQAQALYPVQEIKYGKFRREVKLPDGVTAAHVRSMLAEGMLTISWPRDPSSFAEHARASAAAAQNTGGGGDDTRGGTA